MASVVYTDLCQLENVDPFLRDEFHVMNYGGV